MKKRRICIVITSRGNYGKMKSIVSAIKSSSILDLSVILGGSILLDKYGRIMDSELTDDIDVDHKVHFVIEGENLLTMAKSAGLALLEFASAFENLQPTIVVVIADRFECLPIATAAAYMNIPVAHIEGGEVSGSIDESIRHAITKLSHLHFPATEEARDRIIRMGEPDSSVFCVGSSSLDALKELDLDNLESVRKFQRLYGVGEVVDLIPGNYIVVIHHPVTTEYERSYQDARQTIEAVQRLALPTIWIWPNMDAGSDGVSRAIRRFREEFGPNHVHFHKSLPIETFGPLLNNAGCILGNSSSGIREAEFLGTPTVNVGTRQAGRARGINVVDVGYQSVEIQKAVTEQMAHGKYTTNLLYGDGNTAEKILTVLETYSISRQKQISY